MKIVSFELTMPNVGSWNGKWTGADRKYYIVRKFSDKFFKENIATKFDSGKIISNFHYSWSDGWGANVSMEIIEAAEGRKRIKLSKGFAGYDWMVTSIIQNGYITTEREKKTIEIQGISVPLIEV